ncbi:MAG TPA: hypothetical protein DHU65_01200 [Clostridiales bacterium]|nr:hypothetical protein [Clostridiales bacterium]
MKKLITIILAVLMTASVMMFGCNKGSSGTTVTLEEGKTYSNQIGVVEDGSEVDSNYRKDIFYRNDVMDTCADPFAFRCEDETDEENYGTYFLIGTTGVGIFNMFFSKDLVSWEPKAGIYTYTTESWEYNNTWAPEIVWDKNADPEQYGLEKSETSTGVYFFYYSSTAISKVKQADYDIGLAVSTCPYGPYQQWTGVETGATIAGVNYAEGVNFAKYTDYADEIATKEDIKSYSGEKYIIRGTDSVTTMDPWLNTAALRASLKFQWDHSRNNPENAANIGTDHDNTVVGETYDGTVLNSYADLMQVDESRDVINCNIDMSPFVDPITGDYYMYWSFIPERDEFDPLNPTMKLFQGQNIYVIKFLNHDWSQPDYSTVTRITRTHYNMLSAQAADVYNQQAAAFKAEDYVKGYKETALATFKAADGENREAPINGGQGDVNEGPFCWYNEETGLYYLTFSVAGYTTSNYSLVQAVAYSPMGPFRKLDLAEGGVMLTADGGRTTDNVSGPGHHSFVKCGDEVINVYHKHKNREVSVHDRGANADRLLFIKNDQGMYVMYTNGPTTAIQPKFYGTGTTKYDIISGDATVTTDDAGNNTVKYLTDGILSMHVPAVAPFVHEFTTKKETVKITLDFGEYRNIAAIMIYNSKNYADTFDSITKIEMEAKLNDTEFTAVIDNLQFYWNRYSNGSAMRPGGSAVAAFNEMGVKKITITVSPDVNNPAYQENKANGTAALGISEIYVLGVPKAN